MAEWSSALDGQPVLLASSVREARLMVAQGLDLDQRSVIQIPATITRDLAHTLDRTGACQRFAADERPVDLIWQEPIGGIDSAALASDTPSVLDFADTLPSPGSSWSSDETALVAIFGLHLSANPERSGALLLFDSSNQQSMTLYRRLQGLASESAVPDGAMSQLARLAGSGGLANRQQRVVTQVRDGIVEAAGLPAIEAHPMALPVGVGLQIPDIVEASIFATYVRGELTPFSLLSELRPPMYRYFRQPGTEAGATLDLQGFVQQGMIPCGPDFLDEEIVHAVLGVVKAAEYVGVRWWTDPQLAAQYAQRMTQMYGPEHDAYRPAFPVPEFPLPHNSIAPESVTDEVVPARIDGD
ncbi:MAG: hypothetical protein EA415_06485 [Sphaerobacteraceae bacterium]|nr:MAG: hypothetical protein EA415_06485 [Sphaerobacteraceae bacterium]